MARRYIAPARREWLVPGLWDTESLGNAPGQVESAADWSLPLGNQQVGDTGTKIHANGLVRVQQTRDPTGPPGTASASHPLGPYTIERIVGTANMGTDNTNLDYSVGCVIFGVFDTGNPYEASGTTPNIDRLRTQEGVMHCASACMTADSSGPAVVSVDIDIRTKRIVVPGKSFYIINHSLASHPGYVNYRPYIKVLVRYAR